MDENVLQCSVKVKKHVFNRFIQNSMYFLFLPDNPVFIH